MKIRHVMIGMDIHHTLQLTNRSEFVQNILSGQKIKLADQVRNMDLVLTRLGEFTCKTPKEHAVIRVEDYELTAGNVLTPPVFYPSVNNLSFNPYIYKVNDNSSKKNMPRTLIFVTLATDAYRMLRYHTDMSIITTMACKKNNQVTCVCRAEEGDSFEIYLRSIAMSIYSSMTFTADGPIKFNSTWKGRESIRTLRQLDEKRRKHPVRFRFCAPEAPRYVVTKGKNTSHYLTDIEVAGDLKDIIEVNIEDENFNFHDTALTSALIGEDLKRTKAIICTPDVSISAPSLRALGISYVFKLSYDKDSNPYITLIRTK